MLNHLRKHHIRWLVVTIIACILAYGLCLSWVGLDNTLVLIHSIGLMGGVALLSLSLINYGLRFLRWQLYLSVMNHKISLVTSGLIYISGFALTTTPGKSGELLRGFFLRKKKVPYSDSTAAFLSERISDCLAIIMLCLAGMGMMPYCTEFLLICLTLILIFLVLTILLKLLLHFYPDVFNSIRVNTVFHGIAHVISQTQRCHCTRVWLLASILSLIAWFAEAYGLYLVLQWLGQSINLFSALSIYALSMLAGALFFLPGGLGGAEAVMIASLYQLGIPEANAITATIVVRFSTLWFAILLGLVALWTSAKNHLQPAN